MKPQQRPAFSNDLSAKEFLRWYWLKAELLDACRSLGVSTAGSKPELNERIVAKLSGLASPALSPKRKPGPMPEQFTLDTLIGEGWRCNPNLGTFLRQHAGKSFRFNAPVRDFVHTQVGKPVSAIIACYRASVAPGAVKPPLPAQLEYNRHTREFALKYPGATREEILASWKVKRAQPRD
jgi:hypothetical protein